MEEVTTGRMKCMETRRDFVSITTNVFAANASDSYKKYSRVNKFLNTKYLRSSAALGFLYSSESLIQIIFNLASERQRTTTRSLAEC